MANKFDTVMDAIELKLKELVSQDGTGVLKAVERRVITPLTEVRAPVLGLVLTRARRRGGPVGAAPWEADVLLMLCTRSKNTKADESITDLVAEADAKIEALVDAGTAGGGIDGPSWDFWYHGIGDALVPVGAMGTLRISVEGPLKT